QPPRLPEPRVSSTGTRTTRQNDAPRRAPGTSRRPGTVTRFGVSWWKEAHVQAHVESSIPLPIVAPSRPRSTPAAPPLVAADPRSGDLRESARRPRAGGALGTERGHQRPDAAEAGRRARRPR